MCHQSRACLGLQGVQLVVGRGGTQWEPSSAFKLFLLFAKCLWNNAASNATACRPPLSSHSSPLAVLLLIAIMPVVSSEKGNKGAQGVGLLWSRLCLVFRFNFGYMSTWSEGFRLLVMQQLQLLLLLTLHNVPRKAQATLTEMCG